MSATSSQAAGAGRSGALMQRTLQEIMAVLTAMWKIVGDDPVRIAILGKTRSGKTTFVRGLQYLAKVLNGWHASAVSPPKGLTPDPPQDTDGGATETTECAVHIVSIAGITFWVLDTPGLSGDADPSRYELDEARRCAIITSLTSSWDAVLVFGNLLSDPTLTGHRQEQLRRFHRLLSVGMFAGGAGLTTPNVWDHTIIVLSQLPRLPITGHDEEVKLRIAIEDFVQRIDLMGVRSPPCKAGSIKVVANDSLPHQAHPGDANDELTYSRCMVPTLKAVLSFLERRKATAGVRDPDRFMYDPSRLAKSRSRCSIM